MKTPLFNYVPAKFFKIVSISCLLLIIFPLVVNQACAETQKKLDKEITKINKELKNIDAGKQEIEQHKENTEQLKKLNQAEKSGLSKIVKTIAPTGGRFEIQADGAIRITPDDTSIVNKLIGKDRSDVVSDDVATAANTANAANAANAAKEKEATNSDKTNKNETNETDNDNKISQQSREIIERLRKANNQGLSTLLNKLSTGGGKFELIENGGIRIIPDNSEKARALASKAANATKLTEKKDLSGLSKELSKKLKTMKRPINNWSKVRTTAKNWIKKEHRKGLSVGKIRLIKWLYIVSIVTNKGKMDTQLVIRASDGKTVAFSPRRFEVFN